MSTNRISLICPRKENENMDKSEGENMKEEQRAAINRYETVTSLFILHSVRVMQFKSNCLTAANCKI